MLEWNDFELFEFFWLSIHYYEQRKKKSTRPIATIITMVHVVLYRKFETIHRWIENIIVESHAPSYAYLSTTRHLEKIRETETFELIGQWFQQHSSHLIYIAFWQTYKYQKLGTWHLLFNDRISIHWNRLIFGAVLKQSNLRVEVNAMLNRDYAVVCSAFFFFKQTRLFAIEYRQSNILCSLFYHRNNSWLEWVQTSEHRAMCVHGTVILHLNNVW